jgi:hypothetical protein
MWTTLTFIAGLALTPAQPGQLALTNFRSTYGVLGATRSDEKLLPGDMLVMSFDIEGVKADEAGKVTYSIAMEVTDSDGKLLYKQDPRPQEITMSLGGNTIPAYATIQVGLDQPPGRYNVKLIVTDRAAGATQELTKTYEVLPKAFGIVRPTATSDPEGRAPTPFLGDGQSLWVNFMVVGFARGANGQPDVGVSLRVLDADGRPTMPRPYTGEVQQNVPDKARSMPLQFLLDLNRPGKFTIELKAVDKVGGQTATLALPLVVMKTK